MEKLFAQHADVGKLHLEVWLGTHEYWNWSVTDRNHHILYNGTAISLEAAERAAEERADGKPHKWRPINRTG
jgi:hypothetical protein